MAMSTERACWNKILQFGPLFNKNAEVKVQCSQSLRDAQPDAGVAADNTWCGWVHGVVCEHSSQISFVL